MTKLINRLTSALLSLTLVLSIVLNVNLYIDAATVDYVYAEGKFIKNWGVREQVATFLSPNAEKFYNKNNTSLELLSTFVGSTDINKIPSSTLYVQLQDLMEKNQTFITDYGYTRYKYQYTDIQNSGKDTNKISSFYSGVDIGPEWDYGETWNREHTWPNSKGDKAGDGENDIMMLRPTASDENIDRSNVAYGKSSGYYNPNSESGGKHDLRGDVARIMLYQYVRWECTNTGEKYNPTGIFGAKGVIESKQVLLEWMQADPVDTWELGRNDSVESITGTRNVFVDFPELSFILFGEQVPEDYQTPSGSAKEDRPCAHYYSSDCDIYCNTCGEKRSSFVAHTLDGNVCELCTLVLQSGIIGDVYCDQKITSRDYVLLVQYLNDWDVDIVSNAADVNNDGKINGKDCTQLLQYINDWDIDSTYIGLEYGVSADTDLNHPEVGAAYKFGLYQTGVGKTLYATGDMNGYYMATTEDINAAADIYLEATTGGYYIYAMVNGAKKYMNIQLSADGKYVNVVYRDTPDMVFVYDDSLKTMVTASTITKGGVSNYYAFGTYGTYTTISASATTYTNNYWCSFYKQ